MLGDVQREDRRIWRKGEYNRVSAILMQLFSTVRLYDPLCPLLQE